MIRTSGLTDIGLLREENQDRLLILDAEDAPDSESRGTLLVVADGMGGLGQGQRASELAVDALSRAYRDLEGSVSERLHKAVEEANHSVYRFSQDEAGGEPMGSTITAAAIVEHYVCVAQVGDSRAYHFSAGSLRQVTRDHSLVRELVDRGELDPDSFLYRHHRNVLTRGLGLCADVEVDVYELEDVQDGDVLLLSSDGLHELVSEEELRESIEELGSDLDGLCSRLVELARSRGAPDNVTVAVARVGEASPTAPAPDVEPSEPLTETVEVPQVPPARASVHPAVVRSARDLRTLLPIVLAAFVLGLALGYVAMKSAATSRDEARQRLEALLQRDPPGLTAELRDELEALRRLLDR